MLTEREIFISLVDNDLIHQSDAIILLEGDGLNRCDHVIELYKQSKAGNIIFSGGVIDYQYGSYPYSDVLPHLLKAGITEESIIYEDKSQNTREQAIEVIRIAQNRKWRKMILVASPEHQYRAYLTFLKEVLDTQSNIVIYNSSARDLTWFTSSDWGIRYDRLKQEFERIDKYSQLGHLASMSEAIEYQKWKEYQ